MNILATLVYLQKDEKTLMILASEHKHDLYRGKWNGLGGKLQEEETPEECAIREVGEESGLRPVKMQFVGLLTFPKVDRENDWYTFVYTCSEFAGKLKESKEGRLEWHMTKKLLELNLWEGDYIFLPWILAGQLFSAKFIYDEGKLVSHEKIFF